MTSKFPSTKATKCSVGELNLMSKKTRLDLDPFAQNDSRHESRLNWSTDNDYLHEKICLGKFDFLKI